MKLADIEVGKVYKRRLSYGLPSPAVKVVKILTQAEVNRWHPNDRLQVRSVDPVTLEVYPEVEQSDYDWAAWNRGRTLTTSARNLDGLWDVEAYMQEEKAKAALEEQHKHHVEQVQDRIAYVLGKLGVVVSPPASYTGLYVLTPAPGLSDEDRAVAEAVIASTEVREKRVSFGLAALTALVRAMDTGWGGT